MEIDFTIKERLIIMITNNIDKKYDFIGEILSVDIQAFWTMRVNYVVSYRHINAMPLFKGERKIVYDI